MPSERVIRYGGDLLLDIAAKRSHRQHPFNWWDGDNVFRFVKLKLSIAFEAIYARRYRISSLITAVSVWMESTREIPHGN